MLRPEDPAAENFVLAGDEKVKIRGPTLMPSLSQQRTNYRTTVGNKARTSKQVISAAWGPFQALAVHPGGIKRVPEYVLEMYCSNASPLPAVKDF